MRFLIVETYYPAFLASFYKREPHAAKLSYAQHWERLMRARFGVSDFYSRNLRALGHDGAEVIVNGHALQKSWVLEHAAKLAIRRHMHAVTRHPKRWESSVFLAQMADFEPDIVFFQDMNWPTRTLLKKVHRQGCLVVGQTASPLRLEAPLEMFDLVLSSLPHYVETFRKRGLDAEYFQLAFEPSLSVELPEGSSSYAVTFVGGFSPQHSRGTNVLEIVAERIAVDFWGYGIETLRAESPIRKGFHGEAWGSDMYGVLKASDVTLNRHVDVAGKYANNMRLYEATGVGACLVTDSKVNLLDLFQPDMELVTYDDPDDCVEKIRYLLDHPAERTKIAEAGQERTLREHTYLGRMKQLVELVEARRSDG